MNNNATLPLETSASLNRTEGQIFDAIAGKGGPFAEPAHIALRNVRDKTGYGGRDSERYADGLIVSVYPSRGIWFAGVEIKVSKSDWKRELADPEKSAKIQRFCTYWWVAATKGVVDVAELPPTWGLIEVDDKGRCKRIKNAPELTPQDPTPTFVASILRNASTMLRVEYNRGAHDVRKELADADHRIREAERAADTAQREAEQAKRDLSHLKETYEDARSILSAAGVNTGYRWGEDKARSVAKVRTALEQADDAERLVERAAQMERSAVAIREAAAALQASEEQR